MTASWRVAGLTYVLCCRRKCQRNITCTSHTHITQQCKHIRHLSRANASFSFFLFSFFIFAGAKIIQVRSVLEHCCSLCAKRTQARGRKPGCKACGWQHQRSLLREGQGRLTKYVQTPTLALPRPHPPHCVCVCVCGCVCLVLVLFLPFLFLAFLASFFPFPCFPFLSWLHGVKLTAALFVPLLLSPLPGSQSLSPLTSRHKASDTPLPFGLLVSTFFFLFVFVCSLSLLLFVRALCCLLSFAVFFFLPFFLPRSNALHATCNVPSNEVKTKCCHPCTSMPTVTLCLASATSC